MRGWTAQSFRGILFLWLLNGAAIAQTQGIPASQPAQKTSESAPRDKTKPSAAESAPTDAEKIARLQRSVDETMRQVNELRAKLNDPKSEFKQAEAEFTKLDSALADARKELLAASDEKKREFQQKIDDLEPKHKLAKDRFDLAIQERKTLQEQISTFEKRTQQDTDALKKLKGEQPPTSQPVAAESSSPAAAPPAVQPAPTGVAPAPANIAAPQVSTLPIAPPTAAAPANGSNVEAKPADAAKAAPELIEARQEASRKHAEAQQAEAELESIGERMGGLRKSIELERNLYETTRKKMEIARETERTAYETLQKKWEEGVSQTELSALRTQINESRERLRDAQNELSEHTDRLDQYQVELSELQAEQIAALEQAEQRRDEAAQAQKRVEHLESPFSPQNLWRWTIERGPKVAGIVIVMVVLIWMSRFAEGRLVRLMIGRAEQGSVEDRENRAHTLIGVFHSAVTAAVYAGGGLMILTELGVNIVPLMGGAAVIGLAVAFGAQNLIRDYFYGFMILLENQYTINDVIKIGDVSGQVERITLRVTVLRGLDGAVHFVPNGEISRVSNLTHEWSRAVFDIPVAYKEDVDLVMRELIELAKELRRDPEFRGLILEMPEMLGVDEFADSAVVIKFLVKTRPLRQWTVKRELLRRIKLRFDELGIEIPFPHRTLYHRYEDGAAAREPRGELARPQGATR